MSEIADAARVIAWANSKPRKPANLAFTAGPERQAAYWIEWAEARVTAPAPEPQTENVHADKLATIMQRDGGAITGQVLALPSGDKCIVDKAAVRWLTKAEMWWLMHESQSPLAPELAQQPEQKVCEWTWANGAWVSGCKAWARPVSPLNHGQTVCRCGLPIREVDQTPVIREMEATPGVMRR